MLRPALLVAILLVAVFTCAAGETPDPHFIANRTSAIARRSAFVHGYLHGYEQGFHLADLDLQLGRGARDVSKCKEAKEGEGYRREFGDKHFFEHGYLEGIRVGYADGVSGRTFRAFTELEAISAMGSERAEAQADRTFDQGFSFGYESGQRQGLKDGRGDADLAPSLPPCPMPPKESGERTGFCEAFVSGYRIGYSDGFTNVNRAQTAQFEARAGR